MERENPVGGFQCFGYASLKDSFFIDLNYATLWNAWKYN